MSAEPVQLEDPNDPKVILRDLPEQERGQFLRQYHEAVDAAHDQAGYRRLRRFLHAWRLTVIATGRSDAVTYRAELSDRVLTQLGDFPAKASDAMITATFGVLALLPVARVGRSPRCWKSGRAL